MQKKRKKNILCTMLFYVLLLNPWVAQAAELSNSRGLIFEHPGSNRLEIPEYQPAEPKPGLALPPTQTPIPSATSTPSPSLTQKKGLSIDLQGVAFEGNTVFTDKELAVLAIPFVGRRVMMLDLEELRYRLTRYYTDQGYRNSGVIIKPGQVVNNGIVIFEIREGRLQEIRISGTERLASAYVADRIWPDHERPFNTQKLQEHFQLLLQDPLIERMDGRLSPGVKPGSAALDLQVSRAKPYQLSLNLDNSGSPSSGAERGRLAGIVRNLTGLGDSLEVVAEFSEGASEWLIDFNIPINRYDTRLSLLYDSTDSNVIEEPLDAIDIENEYETFEVGLSHPLWRNLKGHMLLGATLSLRKNQSYLLGQAFPFAPSDEKDGSSAATALRLWQDYQQRSSDWVLAARSTLSLGLDLFGSTIHKGSHSGSHSGSRSGSLADSRFIAWLGQLQYAQRIHKNSQLVLRADLQLANDKLLSLEQFSLGGINTVRGYRENTLVRDQALLLSAELRYPLFVAGGLLDEWRLDERYGRFELVPFVDYGRGWNQGADEESEELLSLGIGLTWALQEHIEAALYIAHDLKQVAQHSNENLQDKGVHFRITFNLF